jgi:hypothetical protein
VSGDEIGGRGGYRSRKKGRRRSPGFRAKRVRTADREIRAAQQEQVRRAGAPALPEVLNLSSARRDRRAWPFSLWGD